MSRKRKSARKSKKIPILATAGALAFGWYVYERTKAEGLNGLKASTIGVDTAGKWHANAFIRNVAPLAIGAGGSALGAKLGLNRYFAKIPFFKL